MTVYLVVEGETEKKFIETVLRRSLLKNLRVVAASGKDAAVKLASSIMMSRNQPTSVLIDADTSDPREISSEKDEFEGILSHFKNNTDYGLFVVVPDLNAVALKCLSKLAGTAPINPKGVSGGQLTRKDALEALGKLGKMRGSQGWISELLKEEPVLADLSKFVREHTTESSRQGASIPR